MRSIGICMFVQTSFYERPIRWVRARYIHTCGFHNKLDKAKIIQLMKCMFEHLLAELAK